MESVKSTFKMTEDSISDEQGFLNYVFVLNEKDKNDLMNVMQYMVLAIIPLVLILKFMKHYVPAEEPDKGSIELLLEVFFQLTVIFVSFYFIHRMITFIPTYSKMNYPEFSFVYIILPTLLILFTMQTKLGAKINTLNERLFKKLGLETEEEDEEKKPEKNNNKPKKVQQQQNVNSQGSFSHPYSGPNFDEMYLDTKTPLVNANNPTNMPNNDSINNYNQPGAMNEPMAANDFGGVVGSFF
ncbi:hypothetical protein CL656_06175 [bacterium]|nr:hypothetical protein [bacterium]|tara:strand:+ start:3035 stop:3757 length:723 start_codon:yes stop_codon:yes gene_type:complete